MNRRCWLPSGAVWAVAILLLASGLPKQVLAADQPVLRILNWEDYLDPELAAEFGRKHHVRVEETYFESDTERDRRLAGSGAAGFDLVIVDQAQLPVYRDRGWIARLDTALVPGLRHYDSRWRRPADGSATHAIPFAWGTTGIAYPLICSRQFPRHGLTFFNRLLPCAGS